jgi:hypothetical protein
MKLSFYPYVDHRKWSLYMSWASILLQIAPRARGGLELDMDWASDLAWMTLMTSQGGG